MLDLAAFRLRHPEFATAPDALVESVLLQAEEQIDPAVFLGLTDQCHGLLTAHLLAMAPNGSFARLDPKAGGGTSIYFAEWTRLKTAATCAIRVF